MAEAYEVFKQFEYKYNSNLVLQREGPGPLHNEPTGEPESLAGRIVGKMGERVAFSRPPIGQIVTKRAAEDEDEVGLIPLSDLVTTAPMKKRRKTRKIDEVLQEIELEDENHETRAPIPQQEQDSSFGVAVVFDDEDEGAGAEHLVSDAEEEGTDEQSEEDPDENSSRYIAGSDEEDEAAIERGHKDKLTESGELLTVTDVGAHWLQRQVVERGIVSQSELTQKLMPLEKDILANLGQPDLQACENALVQILGFENFRFVSLLSKNRWTILYMTQLGQAQSEEEKSEVKERMSQTEQGQLVLDQLDLLTQKTDKERAFEAGVRKEAASLGGSSNGSKQSLFREERKETLQPSRQLDLEQLAFPKDEHFIGTQDVRLPDGTQRITSKDCDEIVIPPSPQMATGERLDISNVLPQWAQPCFENVGVKHLNLIQSKVFDCAFAHGERNMLVCAPTGAGKTNVAVLTMLNVMSQYLLPEGTVDGGQFKIVYISPMKALVAEQVAAFQKRFSPLGNINVKELTGDVGLSQKQIEETQIIVTTPEKWDVITRKSGDRVYTQLVKLMIFDEIHLLHDSRGPVLEALIARSIRQFELTQKLTRLVGLSATLPNFEDVAIFLRVPFTPKVVEDPSSGLFVFDSTYRPVPLKQSFVGVKTNKALKRYEIMNKVCYEKVMEYAGKQQMLIFVHSRRETVKTAKFLRDTALNDSRITDFFEAGSVSKDVLNSEKENVSSQDLKDLLPFGFAVHHAGMMRKDRQLVEDLFADRHIQVLVSTATLAWGVNLPAHLVIIKGTQVYSPDLGKWTELPPLDVVQMMGRGGRPQYDKSGHGVILTQHTKLQYYISLTNQQLPIESQLIGALPDVINAEIVLGSIRHRQDVVTWLVYTYLFVRMCRNPKLYGMTAEEVQRDPTLVQRRVDLAHSSLLLLDQHRLINYDAKSGAIQTTALGRAASHYYLTYPTVATLNKALSPTLTDIDLFRVFSLVKEFSNVTIRLEEKEELAKAVDRVPIPVKGQLSEPSAKVNVLLQSYISGLALEGFALQADMMMVQQSATRIMRAVFDICLRRGWAKPALLALQYAKVVDRRMWASMTPLRQFNVLSEGDIRRIERRDFPWERFYDLQASELGDLVKNPALGKKLYRLVHQCPRLEASCYVCPLTKEVLQFEITITPDFEWNAKAHRGAELFWVFIENVDGERILHSDNFALTKDRMDKELLLTFIVPLDTPPSPNYFIRLVSDRWLGCETLVPVCFKHLILPAKATAATELLGLQPLPINAINFPEAEEKLYRNMPEIRAEGGVFNAVQSQTFAAIFSSNDNVLLCGPPTCGKTVCAELAIIRMLRTEERPLCVYVAPLEAIVSSKYAFWSHRFGDLLGVTVSRLTGQLTSDLTILGRSNLVLATSDQWEAVSRRWKTRKAVQQVKLIIADYIQMINDSVVGSSMEVAISRSRFVTAALKLDTRIVALGTTLANARDMADWLGVTKPLSHMFNFHSNIRKVPLDLSIHRLELADRQARALTIYQPLGHAVRRSGSKPVIILAPDRREARLLAIELLLQASAEGSPGRYRHCEHATICERINHACPGGMKERVLQETLLRGVGILHEGLKEQERRLVEKLYSDGLIQIIVMTGSMVWGVFLTAALVVVADTEIWDVKKRRYTDYNTNIMTQFLGLANVEDDSQNTGCQFLLFCRSSKREEFRRFVFDPLPAESNLDLKLADHILAEIVTGTVTSKQEALDWLTWTFYYRRLTKVRDVTATRLCLLANHFFFLVAESQLLRPQTSNGRHLVRSSVRGG